MAALRQVALPHACGEWHLSLSDSERAGVSERGRSALERERKGGGGGERGETSVTVNAAD